MNFVYVAFTFIARSVPEIASAQKKALEYVQVIEKQRDKI